MEFWDVITRRQSVRSYLDKPVPEDKIKKILEAARLAPSAHNRQPWKFIVVKDPEKRRQMMQACYNQPMIAQAPVLIVGVALNTDWEMPNGIKSYPVDLAIAMEHITLAATNEGLGSCWVGAFRQEQVKQIMNVPESCTVVAVMPIGYSNQNRDPAPRKSFEEIVCYESFQE
ncbi:MAG: nitroreductase family protein [Dehalococcoidales bacterium]|nr:nitroreductase family protein [Dehalococcoidales bacterium]